MTINDCLGPLRHVSWLSQKGPPTCGQRIHHEQVMLTFQYKVTNGSFIGNTDIPFGYFIQIEPFNSSESLLTIIAAPRTDDSPVFIERETGGTNMNEYICGYTITKQIVEPGTAPDSGANIWESTVTPIDEKHSEKVTVTITSYNQVIQDEWDETLSTPVRITRELTQTLGDYSIAVVTSQVERVTYQEVRCGWWVKSTERFAVVSRSYGTSVEYYWPGVLTAIGTYVYELKDGGAETYVSATINPEAYRGPCKATITETWTVTAPTVDEPTQMFPLPVDIDTPFAGKSIGPTLHGAVSFNIVMSSHPRYENVVANYSWPATSPTARPSTAIASDNVDPVRGGYLRRRIVVDAP
jgi:hypothetical protein